MNIEEIKKVLHFAEKRIGIKYSRWTGNENNTYILYF